MGDAGARNWLRGLSADATLSLYLHVPYCSAICTYCGCNTKAVQRSGPLDAYAATLEQEMALLAAATDARRVTHIHWGGGTPSLMGPERLPRLRATIGQHFDLSHVQEHAIELDPRTVDAQLARALADIGITRASLGVQDLNDHVQRAIGRVQPLEIVEATVAHLRNVGISAINLDLMYGLPEQSVEDVRRTAALAAQLQPSRLAIFGYAHVPWMQQHPALLPEAEMAGIVGRWEQQAAIETTLAGAGFQSIGLDHYARPEDALAKAAAERTMRRNFQGYTTDGAEVLLGLGASSIGALPQGYVQNIPAIPEYRDAVRAGRLPIARGVALSGEDRMRRDVIEQLMCNLRVDLDDTAARHGQSSAGLRAASAALDGMAQDGIVGWDGRTVEVPHGARPFVRNVAAAFDTYYRPGAGRHARAV
jgi:oxygen-independent coproporphyrinogen-3 oxidase